MPNSRIITLKLQVLRELVDIFILYWWSGNNLEKFSWKWDLKRCQQVDTLKVHSGTSMHCSSHNPTQQEICTILSSWNILKTVRRSQKTIWRESRKSIKQVAMDLRDMTTSGTKLKQERTSLEHILPPLVHRCCTSSLNKKYLNPQSISLLIEFSGTRLWMLLTWLSFINARVWLPTETLALAT